jgi:hypothetical protein
MTECVFTELLNHPHFGSHSPPPSLLVGADSEATFGGEPAPTSATGRRFPDLLSSIIKENQHGSTDVRPS